MRSKDIFKQLFPGMIVGFILGFVGGILIIKWVKKKVKR